MGGSYAVHYLFFKLFLNKIKPMDINEKSNKIDFANEVIKTGKKLGADDIECLYHQKMIPL